MAKRSVLTRSEIENLSVLELVKLRLSDDEKRIAREISAERELERQDSVRRLLAESAPLLAELRSVGLEIDNIGAMIMMRDRYEEAIPILLRHLPMPYSDAIRETIARSLAVPEPAVREAWPLLVDEYKKAPMGRGIKAKGDTRELALGAKDGLACALAAAVTEQTLGELIELASDQVHGSSRILLLDPILKSKDIRAVDAVERLSTDPQLATEINAWREKKAKQKSRKS